jgi:hypothetical protein
MEKLLLVAALVCQPALWAEYLTLNKLVVKMVMQDELCRRFLAIPGVGAVTALNVACAIDDPARFRRSRDVAAYFWPDVEALAVRHLDRRQGADQQGRRRRCPAVAIRGCDRDVEAVQGQGRDQKLGSEDRQAPLSRQGGGCGGTQTGNRDARDVA